MIMLINSYIKFINIFFLVGIILQHNICNFDSFFYNTIHINHKYDFIIIL